MKLDSHTMGKRQDLIVLEVFRESIWKSTDLDRLAPVAIITYKVRKRILQNKQNYLVRLKRRIIIS